MQLSMIPAWVYWPVKIILVAALLSPVYFWVTAPNGAKTTSPPVLIPSPSFTTGIDVSHYQGIINWDKVGKSHIQFVYTKATSGNTYVDPHFYHNWNGLRTTELYRGAYHFFLAEDDPTTQAQHFIRTLGKLKDTDLPPMLDVEILDHETDSQLEQGALVWLQTVEKATGRVPILYTGSSFGTEYLKKETFNQYPLWVADYANRVKSIPLPWKDQGWTLWQHSDTGQIDGISGHVDLSRFRANLAQFELFIKNSHVRIEANE